jgi:FkbM family methyltransferase
MKKKIILLNDIGSRLREDLEKLILDWKNADLGSDTQLLDALFLYRILLSRMPSNQELHHFLNSSTKLRETLSQFLNSDEFSKRLDLIPGNHLLMAELDRFRFWFNSSDREMGAKMAAQVYEVETVGLFQQLVKPGMACLDVGAQTGFYSLLMASLVGKKGKVHAFEPLDQSYELVEKNVKENNFGDIIHTMNVACSNSSSTISADIASGMVVASPNGSHSFSSIKIDDLNLDKIDFCKIDIEGHEPAAILGMEALIERCKPMILTEVNDYWLRQAGSSAEQYILLLRELGYTTMNCESGFEELTDYSASNPLEVVNILAIHKDGPTIDLAN